MQPEPNKARETLEAKAERLLKNPVAKLFFYFCLSTITVNIYAADIMAAKAIPSDILPSDTTVLENADCVS